MIRTDSRPIILPLDVSLPGADFPHMPYSLNNYLHEVTELTAIGITRRPEVGIQRSVHSATNRLCLSLCLRQLLNICDPLSVSDRGSRWVALSPRVK